MKIAIIGAGFTGLTAAYTLVKQGHEVVIYEKNAFAGGLASGVRRVVDNYPKEWDWDIERFYHHWFTNDDHMLSLIKEMGLSDNIVIPRPMTAVWYNNQQWQLDSPLSVLRFSPISLISRFRMGAALAYLKYMIKEGGLDTFEHTTAHEWLTRYMGKEAYQAIWEPLLKGKFGPYYDTVNMTWFWARIHKRTPRLAYYRGGFDNLVQAIVDAVTKRRGKIRFNTSVSQVAFNKQKPDDSQSAVSIRVTTDVGGEEQFDYLIVTTPLPIASKIMPDLPQKDIEKIKSKPSLGAFTLLFAFDTPFMKDVYWLNVCNEEWPFIAVVEHTNLVSNQHYGGKHIVYVGNYLPQDHPLMSMDKEQLVSECVPYLRKINPSVTTKELERSALWMFKEPYAQPVVHTGYGDNILPVRTTFPNVFLATMSQVYPWDRGTNYAVEMGRRVANMIYF